MTKFVISVISPVRVFGKTVWVYKVPRATVKIYGGRTTEGKWEEIKKLKLPLESVYKTDIHGVVTFDRMVFTGPQGELVITAESPTHLRRGLVETLKVEPETLVEIKVERKW